MMAEMDTAIEQHPGMAAVDAVLGGGWDAENRGFIESLEALETCE